jgi:hypothetical protein
MELCGRRVEGGSFESRSMEHHRLGLPERLFGLTKQMTERQRLRGVCIPRSTLGQ